MSAAPAGETVPGRRRPDADKATTAGPAGARSGWPGSPGTAAADAPGGGRRAG